MNNILKSMLIASAALFAGAAAAYPEVTFSPANTVADKGSTFSVDIHATGFGDLQKYQFSLGYNPTCIRPIEVIEGPYLKSAGKTTFSPGTINQNSGQITKIAASLLGDVIGAEGSDSLLTVKFEAINVCNTSNLVVFAQRFYSSELYEIGAEFIHGTVSVKERPVAVASLLANSSLITTGAAIVDSNVYVWGFRGSAQQGNNKRVVSSNAKPEKVHSLSNIQSLNAGAYHLLALDSNGNIWGWGQSIYGETGCPATYVSTPCKVLSQATQIATGEYFSVALDANGKVWTWGHNLYGQLGNGGRTNSKVPVAVYLNGEKARLIGGAYEGAFAVTEEGHVWAWGDNEASGLGFQGSNYGVQRIVRTPTRVTNLDRYADQIVQIAGGNGWGEALLDDGRVIGWGLHAALGQGTTKTNISSPQPIVVMSNVSELFARYVGSVALTTDGSIYTWGQTGGSAFPMIYGASPSLRANTIGHPVAIGGGKENLFYQNEKGDIYGVGYNDLYKLNQSRCCGIINWPGSKISIK